jgi:hypothetical protein
MGTRATKHIIEAISHELIDRTSAENALGKWYVGVIGDAPND